MKVQSKSVLSKSDKIVVAVILVFWAFLNCVSWVWWSKLETESLFLWYLVTMSIFYNMTFLPTAFLFFVTKMRTPTHIPVNQALKENGGPVEKVALITLTVVGAENPDFVVRQLKAMKDVNHAGYAVDIWLLCDGAHSDELKKFCDEQGVFYFSRHDKSKWGPRTATWNSPNYPYGKSKAGNVNSWLDAVGYESYSHFVQFDVDHNPRTEYLDKTLGYFSDSDVAWVQSPSVIGSYDSWIQKGAAELEFVLQFVLQLGFYGFAKTPMIIGSHCVYSMAAIHDIGGFQPTRAEDHLDTVELSSAGYQGVYVPEVLAIGDGPETFDTFLAQQFAWAYSMTQVLKDHTPRLIKTMRFKPAIQFLFCQTWYPLFSLTLLILFLSPGMALALNKSIVRVSWVDFAVHSAPIGLCSLLVWLWTLKWNGLPDVTLSWRGVILHVARWPAILNALLQALLKLKKPYMITPKGVHKGSMRPFNVSNLMPYVALINFQGISGLIYVFHNHRSPVQGNFFFLLYGLAFVVLLCTTTMVLDFLQILKEDTLINAVWGRKAILALATLMCVFYLALLAIAAPYVKETVLADPTVHELFVDRSNKGELYEDFTYSSINAVYVHNK